MRYPSTPPSVFFGGPMTKSVKRLIIINVAVFVVDYLARAFGSGAIIYNFGHEFNLKTNIRRADISENEGWAVVEMEGAEKDIEQAIAWSTSKGVRIDPVTGDIAEG